MSFNNILYLTREHHFNIALILLHTEQYIFTNTRIATTILYAIVRNKLVEWYTESGVPHEVIAAVDINPIANSIYQLNFQNSRLISKCLSVSFVSLSSIQDQRANDQVQDRRQLELFLNGKVGLGCLEQYYSLLKKVCSLGYADLPCIY